MHQSYQPLSHGSVFTHITEGFYAISVNCLRKKHNRNLRIASHAGGWLLDREFDLHVGQFWPGAWPGTHPTAWHGMRVGTPTRSSQVGSGRPVLPLTMGSRGLLIYPPIYIYNSSLSENPWGGWTSQN
jgi:hypothetical protein